MSIRAGTCVVLAAGVAEFGSVQCCILVPTGPGVRPQHRLEAALELARRTHAHINALYIGPGLQITLPPSLPVGAACVVLQRNDLQASRPDCWRGH